MIEKDLHEIIDRIGIPIYDFEDSDLYLSGACGFLGSWYTAIFQLLNKEYFKKPIRIHAVDSGIASNSNNQLTEIKDSNIHFVWGDVSRNEIPNYDFQYVIHAAGVASPVYYRKYPVETIDGMVLGLSNLMKHAVRHPVKSFFVFSSSEMYGNPHPEYVPTPETYYGNVSAIGPRSQYDESKRMEEAMCVAYHRAHNVPVKWVRPFNVYGPGMRVNDDRVVPKFLYQIFNNQEITVHIPGAQTRTMCYVTDAMVGFLKTMLIGKNGEVYNIGRQKDELAISDLAIKMVSMFAPGHPIKKIEMPTEYPQDQAQRRCPDLTKAKQQLDYQSTVTLADGLRRTYEWAKKNW